MFRFNKRSLRLASLAGSVMMLTATAGAATYTWTGLGGSGDWGDNNNWDAAPTFDNAAELIFTGATQPVTFLNVVRTVNSLTFDANADTARSIRLASTAGGGTACTLTLGGGGTAPAIIIDAGASAAHTLGVSDGSIVLAGDLTVTHNGTANFTINRPVTGGFGLTKAGTGTMTLLGGSTYSGATTINGGMLVLDTAGGNTYNGGNIFINNGSTVRLTPGGGDQFWFTSKTFTFSSSGGGILDTPGMNFVIQNPTIVTSGGAQNTISRSSGTGFGFNLNGTTATFNVSRGSDETSDLLVTAPVVNSGSVVKTGNGILSLNGVNTYNGTTTVNGGTLIIGGAGVLGNGTYNYALAMANGASFVYASSAAQAMNAAISGSGSLSKTGSGTLTLSGANTYSGATTISSGILSIASGGSMLNSLNVTVAAGAQMTLANTGNVIADLAALTLDGTMTLGAGVNETVGGLRFGTEFQAAGTWGSSSSAATHTDDTHFTPGSTGMLTVAQPQALVTTFSFPGYPTRISSTNITCMVPAGTSVTALAPTYTLSVGATCDRASGAAQDFTTPLAYTVISSDALVTNVYRVTVNVVQTPVINDLALWLDASQLTGLSDGAQVDTWTDLSGLGNNALRLAGTPKYVVSGINGLPVVRFNIAAKTGDNFRFNRISTIRTVFWVLKESSAATDQGFLLGDDSAYHFHRGGTRDKIWAVNDSSAFVRQGTTKLMGLPVNGTTTPLPSDAFKLISLVTTGNVQANQITLDRNITSRNWCGDIAEILIFNRALTSVEENSVGAYLSAKYALTTGYEVAPQAEMKNFGGTGISSVITGTNIACTVHYATAVTNLAPVFTLSIGATCDKASGSFHDFTTPVTYTVVSSELLVTNNYVVTVTRLPDPGTTLIGHWVSGAANLADTAGFTPPGTHDGVAVGPNAAALAYSMDVPPDFSGKSLNLTAGNVAVSINNTKISDGAYTNTFDNSSVRSLFTITFWAKGFPASWQPWVSKEGESVGWQVRRYSTGNSPTFSVRGTAGSDDYEPSGAVVNVNDTGWHHFAAVFDGVAGTRQLYVDGIDRMNLTGDFGLVGDASATSLQLGARSGTGFFSGLLYDVRFYAMALDSNEVQNVKMPMAVPQAQIYSMSIMGLPAVIAETAITVTVPYDTDVTMLTTTYTMSSGAMCDKASGTPQDFSNPVTYTVTSSDSGIVTVYTVTVVRAPDWPAVINVNYSGNVSANMSNIYSWDTEARGSASQAAPAAYSGKNWNDFAGGGVNSANLKDSKGAFTGIGLTTTMWQGPWNQGWTAVGNARLQRDGLTGGNTSYGPMLSFSGLNPNHTYDLYITSASWGDEYLRIGSETKHLVVAASADWVEDGNYVLFKRQKPNADGTLVVEALAGTGNRYDIVLNGFQLVDRGQNTATLIKFY